MASPQFPALNKGEKMPPASGPLLGKKRVNKVIAICNAINNVDVKVISAASTGDPVQDAQTAVSASLILDSQGHGILTIPVPPAASSGTNTGWHWTGGTRNYNQDSTYVDQQLVYVQPTSAAVTTGLPDADTLGTSKSIAGIWVALQPVAPVTSSGTTYYHVPKLPMPVPGDMDNAGNYWALVSQDPTCV